ncbi:MAG: ATP-binding cassette domain-containing protein [Magnetococcales bacterium]|nr:ATP-binding cassette domain-containing protein [Magnetococcales bacterium]NGZ28197.1 ATP-binding cassette domain-containing protein [Magnetococcales bacterium]
MSRSERTDKELLLMLYERMRPYRSYFIVAIISMVFLSGLTSLQAYLIKPILDKIFIEKNQFYFELLPIVIFIVFLGKGICYYFSQYFLELVGQSIVRDFRRDIFRHVQSLSTSFFHAHSTGELMSRIFGDVAMVQSTISSASIGMIRDSLQIISLVGLIFYLDWQFAIFCFGFILVAFAPVILFSRMHRRLGKSRQEVSATISKVMLEAIQGNIIIKAFSMEQAEILKFVRVLDDLFQVSLKSVRVDKISHVIMELIGGIGIIAIIMYGGGQVMNGTSSTGTFFSFLAALLMTYEPIKGITKLNSSIQQGLASLHRITWLLDQRPEIQDREDAVELPPFTREISFKEVKFDYGNPEHAILKGVDLTIARGSRVAIVGHSGSGKTTLANLLPRFFDIRDGSIQIDDHDIRQVTIASLRQQISLVTQNTVLFNDTVRNNIAYGAPDSSEEEIRRIAAQANALEFIEALPDGFDTLIGEAGVRISGGQRQRLAVARAFLKNAPILILDEATSALDTQSEKAVQTAIEQLMVGRTVIIIAHRLSTVESADQIIVMKEGVVIERGTHNELLANPESAYRRLYRMQGEEGD